MAYMNKQKQAIFRGYQAYLDGVKFEDNYYIMLGSRYSVLAGFWDKGYIKAKKNDLNKTIIR